MIDYFENTDLLQLWESEELCDVIVRACDGHEIRAHRIVIAASSAYFRSLFVGAGRHMLESHHGKDGIEVPVVRLDQVWLLLIPLLAVHCNWWALTLCTLGNNLIFPPLFGSFLSDQLTASIVLQIAGPALTSVLEFCYSKKPELNMETVGDIFLAADYLGISRLHDYCCQVGNAVYQLPHRLLHEGFLNRHIFLMQCPWQPIFIQGKLKFPAKVHICPELRRSRQACCVLA